MMEEQLKVRTKLRTKATKLSNDLREYRQRDPKSLNQDDLAFKIHKLKEVLGDLRSCQSALEGKSAVDETSHEDVMEEEIFKASRLLSRLEEDSKVSRTGAAESALPILSHDMKSSLSVKIPVFAGDLMRWPEFWELFSVYVHNSSRFVSVQKFVLLKSHLTGLAKQAIEGIPVTGDGYDSAVKILKERFEQNDVRRDNLMKAMLNLPAISNESDIKSLRNMADHLTAHTRALSTLGVSSESFSLMLLSVVVAKIPEAWRVEWARQDLKDFESFLKFLQKEVKIRELAKPDTDQHSKKELAHPSSVTGTLSVQRQANAAASNVKAKQVFWSCKACGKGQHGLSKCDKYRQMSVEARWKVAKEAGVCFQCLGPRHHARDCTSRACSSCNGRHHASLHHGSEERSIRPHGSELSAHAAAFTPPPGGSAQTAPSFTRDSQDNRHHRYSASTQSGYCCYYQTAVVKAEGPNGHRLVRVLLDGGSDTSFIRSSLAEELGLPTTQTSTFACIGFQEKMEEPRLYNKVKVSSCSRFGDEPVDLELWGTDMLCSSLKAPGPPAVSSMLPDRMADDFSGGKVDILIGIDYLYDIILWDQIAIGDGLRAIDTVFGYVMHGRKDDVINRKGHHQTYHTCRVEQMWDLETVGISAEETAIPSGMDCSNPEWSDEEGRYVMGLLWKSDCRPMSNLLSTKIRTMRMLGKLDEEQLNLYAEKMSEMLSDAVIEHVPEDAANPSSVSVHGKKHQVAEQEATSAQPMEPCRINDEDVEPCEGQQVKGMTETEPASQSEMSSKKSGMTPMLSDSYSFFLPHHGVYRNGKLRIVFDGSAKDGSGQSLNDYLDPGDNLLRKLPAVVLNFRSGPVGSQADIKAAFHQVGIEREDRKFLQFFWSNMRMQFARAPFGLSCSPFLLLRTMNVHLEKYTQSDLELCEKIRAGIYMDDICISFTTREEAETGMERTTEIFSEAAMELHKVHITGDQGPTTKVLGMAWDTQTDQMAVEIPEFPCPTSKSELLSAVSKPFDPLGLLTPWLIGGKALFQRTWKEMPNVGWHDPLTADLQNAVNIWWKNVSNQSVWFPRPLVGVGDPSDVHFHVFCDASERAYCAVVYIVHGGETTLVMAKGRLAPMNPRLTIPRLEHMAALIGARLMTFIRGSLHLEKPQVTFWTDSTDVLFWIRVPKPRKTFVQNRISAILQLTSPEQWQHVRGTENPADLGTRGISLHTLAESETWWTGPTFLLQHTLETSPGVSREPSPEAQKEDKKESSLRVASVAQTTLKKPRTDSRPFDILECSSLKQAINRTAWVMRFVHNVRHDESERRRGPLTSEERQHALQFWIRDAQSSAYEQELKALETGSLLPAESKLLKLRPQLDVNGLLCTVPRTNEPPLPILPEFAHVTTLVIDDAHCRCFHQGARTTLALLSAEYMVRRRSVLRVINTCRRCRRYRGLGYRSEDGSLPSFRTEPSRPFSKVGLDFLGPLMVDPGTKTDVSACFGRGSGGGQSLVWSPDRDVQPKEKASCGSSPPRGLNRPRCNNRVSLQRGPGSELLQRWSHNGQDANQSRLQLDPLGDGNDSVGS